MSNKDNQRVMRPVPESDPQAQQAKRFRLHAQDAAAAAAVDEDGDTELVAVRAEAQTRQLSLLQSPNEALYMAGENARGAFNTRMTNSQLGSIEVDRQRRNNHAGLESIVVDTPMSVCETSAASPFTILNEALDNNDVKSFKQFLKTATFEIDEFSAWLCTHEEAVDFYVQHKLPLDWQVLSYVCVHSTFNDGVEATNIAINTICSKQPLDFEKDPHKARVLTRKMRSRRLLILLKVYVTGNPTFMQRAMKMCGEPPVPNNDYDAFAWALMQADMSNYKEIAEAQLQTYRQIAAKSPTTNVTRVLNRFERKIAYWFSKQRLIENIAAGSETRLVGTSPISDEDIYQQIEKGNVPFVTNLFGKLSFMLSWNSDMLNRVFQQFVGQTDDLVAIAVNLIQYAPMHILSFATDMQHWCRNHRASIILTYSCSPNRMSTTTLQSQFDSRTRAIIKLMCYKKTDPDLPLNVTDILQAQVAALYSKSIRRTPLRGGTDTQRVRRKQVLQPFINMATSASLPESIAMLRL